MGEVSEYVLGLDEPARSAIGGVYRIAREAVPDAVEGMGYGMPALRYRDKPLLAVMQAKAHLGLYPFSPAVIEAVADRLGEFDLAKGTIRFTPEHPLPDDVVADLVRLRRDEIDASASGHR
ncbi:MULTISPECIES: iron chaperone [unclassified Agromyces]|uniref:iron chaperone n=1 Tax=unclassified Agromyces TaxID=2639701 RepID=UPI0030157DA3